MPIYRLSEDLIFPPVSGAEDGVVAIGGDLTTERLLIAYREGIFPWYSEGEPIIWWSPDPRFVLFTHQLHISQSMKRLLKKDEFQVTFNQCFERVIRRCKEITREGQAGTWITDEMEMSYIRLHQLGHAESVEVWKDGVLVGGMYGVRVGRVFSGESMFSAVSNASKIAIVHFIKQFSAQGGQLLDCQVHSAHMERLGAEPMSRDAYLNYLS